MRELGGGGEGGRGGGEGKGWRRGKEFLNCESGNVPGLCFHNLRLTTSCDILLSYQAPIRFNVAGRPSRDKNIATLTCRSHDFICQLHSPHIKVTCPLHHLHIPVI